jgi:tetratricopeptide (TPR) repeat protein
MEILAVIVMILNRTKLLLAASLLLGTTASPVLGLPTQPIETNQTANPTLFSLGGKPTIRSLLPDDSLQEYCRDVRINAIVIPSFCSLLVNAQTRYQQGNFQGSIQLYDRVLSQRPSYGKGYYNRAMARLALGQTEAARQDLNRAAQLFQSPRDISYQQLALATLADLER